MNIWDKLDQLLPEPDSDASGRGMPCTWCGNYCQGNYTIHVSQEVLDNGENEEVVPLCDDCGGDEFLTCRDVWNRIEDWGATTVRGKQIEPKR